jgi:hypothetical protein
MEMLLEFTHAMVGEIDSNAPISLKNIKTFLTMLKKNILLCPDNMAKAGWLFCKNERPSSSVNDAS